jgi:amidase
MSPFPDYDSFDAIGLADLIRKKEISPEEVSEEAILRIESINPTINAVTLHVSKKEKACRNRIFSGVPFLTRDPDVSFSGIPLPACARAMRNNELLDRCRNSGVVILGRTHTPGSYLRAFDDSAFFGPVRNPWNLEHEPGGAGGGSAAAVAGGMVPMALGADAGGSLRIPASCCGLFGLKPSRGRTPSVPQGEGTYAEHVVTRTVRDSAAMLDAVQGPDLGAPYVIPAPGQPYLGETEQDPPPLRIAFTIRTPLDADIHPECRKAVEDAASLLEFLGHRVEEAEPDIDGSALARSFFMLSFSEMSADISESKSLFGRKPMASDLEDTARVFKLLGDVHSACEFVQSIRKWNVFSRQMGEFFRKYDLFLTPTLASPPPRTGEMKSRPLEKIITGITGRLCKASFDRIAEVIDEAAFDCLAANPFTPLANITGLPAMSLPLHWTTDLLPCGVHLTGRFGGEDMLFRLAAQVEKARPWFNKRPFVSLENLSRSCRKESGRYAGQSSAPHRWG